MNKMIRILLVTSMAVLFSYHLLWGQEFKPSSEIYFRQGVDSIEFDFKMNFQTLDTIISQLYKIESDPNLLLTKIEINAYTSPEGGKTFNQSLSNRRAESIKKYLINKISSSSPYILTHSRAIAWEQLKKLVLSSTMKYKKLVLEILDNTPEEMFANERLIDSRLKRLMNLKWGRPYRYMSENMFPQLRSATIVTIFYKKSNHIILPKLNYFRDQEIPTYITNEHIPINKQVQVNKPLLALKTNLFYDVFSAWNIEIEVPLSNKWSISGLWLFPWWRDSEKKLSFQIMYGSLEVKHWLGNRNVKDVMTGWNVGVYLGAGLFDMQLFDEKGIQGDFSYSTGITASFAKKIGNVLRIEYSLGVGYTQTDFRKYEYVENSHFGGIKVWKYPWEMNRHKWFGPTQVKVSLVWLLKYKKKNKI